MFSKMFGYKRVVLLSTKFAKQMELNLAEVLDVSTIEMRTKIYQKLQYKKKYRGRTLVKDLPEFGLKKFSRLMPTPTLPDVAAFEFTDVPFQCHWWVGHVDGRLLHDCPLLKLAGVGLQTWSLDILHGWHLGPLQLLVSLALNYCLDSNLWAPQTDGLDAKDKRHLSLLAIKAELFQFYKEKRKDPDWVGKSSEALWLESRFNLSHCPTNV